MIGNTHFDQMVASAPKNFDTCDPEWRGIADLLKEQDVDPDTILAVSWCSFGTSNIEALVDAPVLAIIHRNGVLSSRGKRKSITSALKFDLVPFNMCQSYGPAEHTDDRGLGKYCIEFAGPGDVLIGRLQWSWRAKRFRDSRQQIMAVASERDRILGVIQGLVA